MKLMTKTQNCNKVYSYARWSSDGQTDGDSLRRQVQMAESWCQRRGLALSGSDLDSGVSAWRGANQREGTGLSRLLKLVKAGDYLLVEDNDRLSRQNWLEACNFLASIVAKDVVVVTLSNGNEINKKRFANDPGCFLQCILASHLGHAENEKRSERIQASWTKRKQDMRAGKPARYHFPCWLAWDEAAGKPVLVEHNASVIRKMFALARDGMGCHSIAKRLHADGDKLVDNGPKHRELKITAPYVWFTLRNKLCAGHSVHVEPSQPGVFPGVVDEPTFFAVQKMLKDNKHQTAPKSRGGVRSLFTGICFCSKCGGPANRSIQNRGEKRYRYLVCSDSFSKHGKCGCASISYDRVEKSFLHLLSQTDFIKQVLAEAKLAAPSPMDAMTGELADVEKQIAKLMALIEGDSTPSVSVYSSIKSKEARAEVLRGKIEAESDRLKAERPALHDFDEFAAQFAGKMEDATCREQVKVALRSFVDRIEVELGKDKYSVQFRGAGQPVLVTLYKGSHDGHALEPSPEWVLNQPTAPNNGGMIG